MLAEIKAVEKLFYGDETDLMKVDTITEEQVDITSDVISSINEACNKTESLLQEVLIHKGSLKKNVTFVTLRLNPPAPNVTKNTMYFF